MPASARPARGDSGDDPLEGSDPGKKEPEREEEPEDRDGENGDHAALHDDPGDEIEVDRDSERERACSREAAAWRYARAFRSPRRRRPGGGMPRGS